MTEEEKSMAKRIDTIFFDVGATLRYVVEDAEFAAAAERELMELVGATEEHDEFFAKLEKNWKAYRKWAKTELLDVSEMELWLQYLLPIWMMVLPRRKSIKSVEKYLSFQSCAEI